MTLPRVECRDGSKLSAWPPRWIPARSPLPRGDRPAHGEEPELQGSRGRHRGQRRRGNRPGDVGFAATAFPEQPKRRLSKGQKSDRVVG